MELYILYIKCDLAIAIGLLVHTASKFQEVKKLHMSAKEPYDFHKFMKDSMLSHIINTGCVLIWMLALPDFVKAIPKVHGSVAAANVVHILLGGMVGYFNSSIILKIFGSGKKLIMQKINEKTKAE